MNYSPDHRLRVVLHQIVPAIIDHPDKEFKLKQLDAHENVANQLNEICENPVADICQFFCDARDEIYRQHKEVERIEPIMAQ